MCKVKSKEKRSSEISGKMHVVKDEENEFCSITAFRVLIPKENERKNLFVDTHDEQEQRIEVVNYELRSLVSRQQLKDL